MLELREKFLSLKQSLGHPSTWSPRQAVLIIFAGSFVLGVLFTALILAGIIEIQPQAIKSFFKALMGKS
jgi:hypothetical protein